jgi:hypothetical protein
MHKELIIPIYGCLVSVYVIDNFNNVKKDLKTQYDIDEEFIECRGCVFNKFTPKYETRLHVLIVKYDVNKKYYFDTIGHELLHLTQDILEHKNIIFKKKDANETYAYLQGYLLSETIEFFEKAYTKFKRLKN